MTKWMTLKTFKKSIVHNLIFQPLRTIVLSVQNYKITYTKPNITLLNKLVDNISKLDIKLSHMNTIVDSNKYVLDLCNVTLALNNKHIKLSCQQTVHEKTTKCQPAPRAAPDLIQTVCSPDSRLAHPKIEIEKEFNITNITPANKTVNETDFINITMSTSEKKQKSVSPRPWLYWI